MKSVIVKIARQAPQELKRELRYLLPAGRSSKILFDHLPKCGGSSLHKYLEDHYPKRKIFTTNGNNPSASVDEFRNYPQSKRHGYDLVKGHLANQLIDYVHPDCLKVTVLRDPIDRIVSHYYYAKRSPQHYLYAKIHESAMSLEDYVTSGLSEELRNWYTTHFSGLKVADAEDNPEKSINDTLEVMVQKYDLIGFLDEYSSFTDTLRDQAKLRLSYQNRKVNVTQGRLAINDVHQSTISKIEQINQLDIVLYSKLKDSIG